MRIKFEMSKVHDRGWKSYTGSLPERKQSLNTFFIVWVANELADYLVILAGGY